MFRITNTLKEEIAIAVQEAEAQAEAQEEALRYADHLAQIRILKMTASEAVIRPSRAFEAAAKAEEALAEAEFFRGRISF